MLVKPSPKGRPMVFDVLRRRYVTLTPEEWVRQHVVNYLVEYLAYPKALMANEMEMRVGEKRLRCDSVLFDVEKKPRMIMEYKAPNVPLTQEVLNQIVSYNVLLGVDYLLMSNGLQHVCLHFDREENKWILLDDIPSYADL